MTKVANSGGPVPAYTKVRVADLIPYARNARTHSDEQVAKIAASIREFGFLNPVITDGRNGIIAGHGRVLAAQKLGLEVLPAIEASHLTDAQRRAYILADNRIALDAGWDDELLEIELSDLRDDGFDLGVIGFSQDELSDILGDLGADAEGLGDPEHVPDAPVDPVSVRGDVWILGSHRVMCGDSTSVTDLEALCGGVEVDACWTDPPYNVNYEGTAGKIQNDHMEASAFSRFLLDAFSAAFTVMRAGGPIYVAHADTEGLAFRSAFRDAGFKLSGCLVWVKPSLVLGRSDYQWRHEPILYGWKPGAAHRWFGGRAQTTVFEDPREPIRIMEDGSVQVEIGGHTVVVSGDNLKVEAHSESVLRAEKPARNAEHPTMKPVELITQMLANSTKRGDVVLDPFGGSGSTLIACHGIGRSSRLMELDERFVDVIVERWQSYTGQVAVLEADGRRFAEVRRSRCKAA